MVCIHPSKWTFRYYNFFPRERERKREEMTSSSIFLFFSERNKKNVWIIEMKSKWLKNDWRQLFFTRTRGAAICKLYPPPAEWGRGGQGSKLSVTRSQWYFDVGEVGGFFRCSFDTHQLDSIRIKPRYTLLVVLCY